MIEPLTCYSLVDLMTAYLNSAEQVIELRRTLNRLVEPDAPADEAR